MRREFFVNSTFCLIYDTFLPSLKVNEVKNVTIIDVDMWGKGVLMPFDLGLTESKGGGVK